MTSSARYVPSRQTKMHPLFVELYLADDAEEEHEDEQQARRKKRLAKVRVAVRSGGGARTDRLIALPAEVALADAGSRG
jgi:hypothetical protein